MPDPAGIRIVAIPRAEARYATDGDWYYDTTAKTNVIAVSAELSADEQFLIALHELVEWKLCQKAGITEQAVDAFDKGFTGDGEPGDDPAAPYRQQHRRAMLIEHMMANFLGITDYGTIE